MAYKKRVNAGGILPPSDVNIEQAVLGAILSDTSAILKVYKDFRPEIFYDQKNRLIAEAILALHLGSRKIDLMTVISSLKTSGNLDEVGGPYYITEVMDRTVSSYHIEDHIEILLSHYIAREQIQLYQAKSGELYGVQDPYDVANEVSAKLISLQERSFKENEFTMQDLSLEAMRSRESLGLNKVEFLGYTTGIKALDDVISGLKQPDFTIIAARPAMGKTIVALSVAKSLAMQVPTAFFSLEMSAQQLYGRLQAAESEIKSRNIKKNDLSTQERINLSYADQALSTLPLYIDDTPALNIDKFRSKLMVLKRKYGIGAAVIDYLGLMKGNTKSFGNSNAEVTEISGKLKRVAKELKMPIIALAQLSRGVESRKEDNFRPKLADLRDSGSLEQDADNVIFLWRPEYYDLKDPIGVREFNMDFLPTNLLMFIVAKCREGETRTVPAYIDPSRMIVKDHPDISYLYTKSPEKLF